MRRFWRELTWPQAFLIALAVLVAVLASMCAAVVGLGMTVSTEGGAVDGPFEDEAPGPPRPPANVTVTPRPTQTPVAGTGVTPGAETEAREVWFSQVFYREVACLDLEATPAATVDDVLAPCPPDAQPQMHYIGALDLGGRGPVAAVFAGTETGSFDRSECAAPLTIEAVRDLLDEYEREGRLEQPASEIAAIGVRCWYDELSLEITYDHVAYREDADGALVHAPPSEQTWLSHIEYRNAACPRTAVTPASTCPPEAPPASEFLLAIDGPNGKIAVVRAEGDTACLDGVPRSEIEEAARAMSRPSSSILFGPPSIITAACPPGGWKLFPGRRDRLIPP